MLTIYIKSLSFDNAVKANQIDGIALNQSLPMLFTPPWFVLQLRSNFIASQAFIPA